MSAVRGYVLWRVKPGVEIAHDDLTFFSPGGYTFTHKSGKHVCFDFCESEGEYIENERMLEWSQKEIDNHHITNSLKEDGYNELIQEQYDINFFKDSKMDLVTIPEDRICPIDEIHCCMDLIINGEEVLEVDDDLYIEPVYMAVYDPYDLNEYVELYNKLTPEEYKRYIGDND
jgi:hypothetical protein